jgi:hypothetical protein
MTSDLLVLRPEILHDPARDESVDAAVDRLAAEFRDRIGPQFIRRIVQNARTDLSGVPAGAVPELVERLARHRLTSV